MRCRDCHLIGFSTAPQDGEAGSIVFVTVSAVFIPALPVPGSHPRTPGEHLVARLRPTREFPIAPGRRQAFQPYLASMAQWKSQKRQSSTGTNCGCAAMIVAS